MVKHEVVTQNLKMMSIMKSSGRTDAEIAKYMGMSLKEFLDILDKDAYIKEVYEKASEKVATAIEEEFLQNVMVKLAMGETEDARWILERTSPKYSKKDKVEVTVKTIDDVIRERDLIEE